MSKIKQEEGIRLVCGNCGHRVFEPELMIYQRSSTDTIEKDFQGIFKGKLQYFTRFP